MPFFPTEWQTQKKKKSFSSLVDNFLFAMQNRERYWNGHEFSCVEKFYSSAMNSYIFLSLCSSKLTVSWQITFYT